MYSSHSFDRNFPMSNIQLNRTEGIEVITLLQNETTLQVLSRQ